MSKKYRLCCLTKNKTNPAYIGAQIGAARLAARLGHELIGYAPQIPDDIDQQRALLESALQTAPDAVLISPVHATALNATLERVVEAGIPLIFFVTSAENIKADSFVTSNNHTLAIDIARYLFEHLGGGGNVAIIEGLPQSPTSAPRTEGFLEAAALYPRINIVASAIGNYQRADGKREMARILVEHPQIDAVMAANDFMALGAIEALDEAGRTATVAGMNAVPDAIKTIKHRKLLATVSYDALSLVCTAVQAAVRILDGIAVPQLLELPADIVDASNCEAWDLPYEERPLPSWDMVMTNVREIDGLK